MKIGSKIKSISNKIDKVTVSAMALDGARGAGRLSAP
jgi:hypothetical protein